MFTFLNDLLPQRQLQALRAQLDQRGGVVNQLEGQLAELRRNMTELSTRHRETLELIDDLESDLEGARRRHEALEADTRAVRALLERESAALRNKDAELGDERKTWGRLEAELRAQIERFTSERLEATQKVTELEAKLSFEGNSLRSAKDAIARLEDAFQQERRARNVLEEKLRGKIEDLIDCRDAIKGIVQNTNAELERVRIALRLAEAECRSERELRDKEQEAAASKIQSAEQSRQETKQLLRETREALQSEREKNAGLRATLDREVQQKAKLALDLAYNPMRHRLAALEEALHFHLGRALDLEDPLGDEDDQTEKRNLRLGAANSPDAPGEARAERSINTASASAVAPSASSALSNTSDLAAASIAHLASAHRLPPLPTAPIANDAPTLDLDVWLNTALSAANNPKTVVLQLNGAALSALAAEIAHDRAETLQRLLLRARVLTLAWSDKALGVAQRQMYGAGNDGGSFDEGDARMSVPLYRKLVRGDKRLQGLVERSGLFRHADILKTYVELTDTFGLLQFCRDAGFALKTSRADEVSDLFSPSENARSVEFAKLIRAAVEAQAATGRDDNSASGLKALARAQERAGRYADALDTYAAAMNATPSDFEARAAAANYLELSGRNAAAERTLRDGLRTPQIAAEAANALRQFYRRTGQERKALAAARLWRRADPSQGALAVAASSYALGDIEAARRALDTVTDTRRNGRAFTRLDRLVQLREGLPELRAAAERGGGEQWFVLGEALRQLDELAAAAEAYGRAETSAPGFLARACGPGIGPDLLLIGPPRTATTLLRKVLELSPSIALLDGESSFLTNEWPTPLPTFLDDLRRVRLRQHAPLVGDKSPLHFALGAAHVALAALLFPHAKVVITTREPVERAWSEVKLFGRRRVTDASIAAALGNGMLPNWLGEAIKNSRYLQHARTWTEHFGERVLLLQSEEFERDVHANCARLFDWLSLEPPDDSAIARLQKNWSNRTANYRREPALGALLEKMCGDEIFEVPDLETALAMTPNLLKAAP